MLTKKIVFPEQQPRICSPAAVTGSLWPNGRNDRWAGNETHELRVTSHSNKEKTWHWRVTTAENS
jgi:hypothetical protein